MSLNSVRDEVKRDAKFNGFGNDWSFAGSSLCGPHDASHDDEGFDDVSALSHDGHSALDTYVSYRDELYDADKLDYKAIGRKVAEIEAVQSKLRASYFDALDKADKVLTEEQRNKVSKLTGGMMHEMEKTPSMKEHMH